MGSPYKFVGPQGGPVKSYNGTKGVMRMMREIKHNEAIERQKASEKRMREQSMENHPANQEPVTT